jgi:integrase
MLKHGKTLEDIDWSMVTASDLELLQRKLLLHNKPSTVRNKIGVVRSLLRRVYARGEMPRRQYEAFSLIARLPKSSAAATGRMLEPEVFARIWPALDHTTPRGRLEGAVIFALVTTGMRVGELTNLKVTDYSKPTLYITNTKTYIPRDVRASGVLQELLEKHMLDHDPECPWLFQGVGENCHAGQLNRDKVAFMLEKLARRADIAEFTPHDLRRTVASTLLANHVDVCTVAKVLGHRNVQTTQGYDRRPETERIKAFATLSNIFEEEREADGREERSDGRRGTGHRELANRAGGGAEHGGNAGRRSAGRLRLVQ